MNYLAHSLELFDDPAAVAGAAVPDWLGLTRPRLRCRSKHAAPHLQSHDPLLAGVARGVVRHHADDGWFHATRAFVEVSVELARRIRATVGDDSPHRPGFLGHILLELLLDARLAEADETLLPRYYEALAEVDPGDVAGAIGLMTGVDASSLAAIIARFAALEFLYDYADNRRLTMRLNQVLGRVGLPALPEQFLDMLPQARMLVAEAAPALLDRESALCGV